MTYVPAEMRRTVIERAGACCEYCLMNQTDSDGTFAVEHIIAEFHGGRTALDNLALSCMRCNLFKGSNIAAADPETGEPTFLFHPRRNLWAEHFILEDAFIKPLTPQGRVTVFVLRLNLSERLDEREILLILGRYPCTR